MNKNSSLAFILSFLVLILWWNWEAQRTQKIKAQQTETLQEQPLIGEAADASRASSQSAQAGFETVAKAANVNATEKDFLATPPQFVEIETEDFKATLTTQGGGLERWQLKKFFADKDNHDSLVTLTTIDGENETELATPFVNLGLGNLSGVPFQ